MTILRDPIQVRTTPPLFYVSLLTESEEDNSLIADWARSTNLRPIWRRPELWDNLFQIIPHTWEVVFHEMTKSELTYLALCVKGQPQ